MQAPKIEHWKATKRVLQCIKGTLDFGILYGKSKEPQLCGYSDFDWERSVDARKSTKIYVFNVGTRTISSISKKQYMSHFPLQKKNT